MVGGGSQPIFTSSLSATSQSSSISGSDIRPWSQLTKVSSSVRRSSSHSDHTSRTPCSIFTELAQARVERGASSNAAINAFGIDDPRAHEALKHASMHGAARRQIADGLPLPTIFRNLEIYDRKDRQALEMEMVLRGPAMTRAQAGESCYSICRNLGIISEPAREVLEMTAVGSASALRLVKSGESADAIAHILGIRSNRAIDALKQLVNDHAGGPTGV
jgi:hypothetical protein